MLITCYECQNQVSDKAVACPHCGAPVKITKPSTTRRNSRPNSLDDDDPPAASPVLVRASSGTPAAYTADGASIDRKALLVYIKMVRDLYLSEKYIKDKKSVELNSLDQKIYKYRDKIFDPGYSYSSPTSSEIKEEVNLVAVFGSIAAPVILAIIIGSIGVNFIGHNSKVWYLLFLLFIIPIVVIPREWSAAEKRLIDRETKVFNKSDESHKMYDPKIKELEEKKRSVSEYWDKELSKLYPVLKKALAVNIIPSDFRNLASVYYIYDNMSTSGVSYDSLLHMSQLRTEIQKLSQKLDYIIQQNNYIIYQNTRLYYQNKQTQEDNTRMLNSLKQIESNTAEAAKYNEISASYSAATAWFSLATYLDRK